jgi:hypothetical protein
VTRPRGLIVAAKPDRKPALVDKIGVWFSTNRDIDGLWVGTTESKPHRALDRIEEALCLIKRYDTLSYSRVRRHLDRIWINLIPNARAHYDPSLNACVLDERYVLQDTIPIARVALTIIHEATHARLDAWGVAYLQEKRTRIEAICMRRELNFLAKIPESETLREEIMQSLNWLAANGEYYSDANFRERWYEGGIETVRYLGTPDLPAWFISFLIWLIRKAQLRRRRKAAASSLPPSRDFH